MNTTDLCHEFNCVLENVSCSVGGLRAALDAFGVVAKKIEFRIAELRELEHGITLQRAELNNREEQVKAKELEVARKEKALVEPWVGDEVQECNNTLEDNVNLNVGKHFTAFCNLFFFFMYIFIYLSYYVLGGHHFCASKATLLQFKGSYFESLVSAHPSDE